MKKILMILVCGFAFTQSIQTKQIEVTINDCSLLPNNNELSGAEWKQIDLSTYLDNLDGDYIVNTIG